MTEEKHPWNSSNIRKYDLKLGEIPRYNLEDPKIDEIISQQKPVVILGSNLVKSAQEKWNLDYLEKNLGVVNNVYASNDYKFKYYDDKKIFGESNPKGVEFTPPFRKLEMKTVDFMKRLREWKKGDERVYLQQPLNPTIGPGILEDFFKFNWEFLKNAKLKYNWGALTSNLLFVSMEGNVTPCHYDEQENLFAQVSGYKRCILFPPSQFENLYPYPVHHPHDRQTMVDFDRPDHVRFPKFKEAEGVETVIGPGEVLYIPLSWWHHIESLIGMGPTITINFWYKANSSTIHYPLKDNRKVSIMRNIEKMLLEVLQDPKEVGPLLKRMVCGRFDE